MPYTLRVDLRRHRVFFKAQGSFPQAEALQAIQDVVGHRDFRTGCDVLVDMTAVEDVPLFGADIREKVEFDKSFIPKIGTAKWAFVATTDVVFGLARMYQLLMDDTSIDVGTFRDLGTAEAWLDNR